MASGFGRHTVGRCYKIFSTFETCMNEEPDSSVCYGLRQQYFNCLHLPTVNTMSAEDMKVMEEGKDTLVLASKALDSNAGAAPAEDSTGGDDST
ncbi:unnamed protein product [Ascophyllum nodosum]